MAQSLTQSNLALATDLRSKTIEGGLVALQGIHVRQIAGTAEGPLVADQGISADEGARRAADVPGDSRRPSIRE